LPPRPGSQINANTRRFIEPILLLYREGTLMSSINGRITGGGGGRIDNRLERDVLAYKPTVMTVMLGMNDGNYKPFDDARERGGDPELAEIRGLE
jgi:lysophospholipase L1-like esterase